MNLFVKKERVDNPLYYKNIKMNCDHKGRTFNLRHHSVPHYLDANPLKRHTSAYKKDAVVINKQKAIMALFILSSLIINNWGGYAHYLAVGRYSSFFILMGAERIEPSTSAM